MDTFNRILNSSLIGTTFRLRLKYLKQSYRIAADEIAKQQSTKKQELKDYRDGVQNGKPAIEERTENHDLVWPHEQDLETDLEMLTDTFYVLRNSFSIAAFHTWEACIQKQSHSCKGATNGISIRRFNELVDAARLMGIQVHPELRKINTLVNLLKHHNPDRGHELEKQWSEVLHKDVVRRKHVDWYEAVCLSAEHIEHVFDVVEKSGPS